MKHLHALTREKHLNHLVRVVPLLALAYGIQGFMMMSWVEHGPTGTLVLGLGVSLAISVMIMVTYDQRHKVSYGEEGFAVTAPWLFGQRHRTWSMVRHIEVIGAEDEFQTVIVKTTKGSFTFYFVDNGHEFKATHEAWLASQVQSQKLAA